MFAYAGFFQGSPELYHSERFCKSEGTLFNQTCVLQTENALTFGRKLASLATGFWRKTRRKGIQGEDITLRHTYVRAAAPPRLRTAPGLTRAPPNPPKTSPFAATGPEQLPPGLLNLRRRFLRGRPAHVHPPEPRGAASGPANLTCPSGAGPCVRPRGPTAGARRPRSRPR